MMVKKDCQWQSFFTLVLVGLPWVEHGTNGFWFA